MNRIIKGDALNSLRKLSRRSVHTCITSPPYWGLRDYGVKRQLGLEPTPEEYIEKLVTVMRAVKRVLRDDGTLWLNLGDTYIGGGRGFDSPKQRTNKGTAGIKGRTVKPHGALKIKDLAGIPWRVAFALQEDGWYLRQDIIWHKPNPMPESVRDRCTKAHEYIFLLSKRPKYHYNHKAIKEPLAQATKARIKYGWHGKGDHGQGNYAGLGHTDTMGERFGPKNGRNKRSVWTVSSKSYRGAHFATFPPDLITPCVLAGAPKGGIVLDPFFGSGTTGAVALAHGRRYIGIELNADYIKLARKRLSEVRTSRAA